MCVDKEEILRTTAENFDQLKIENSELHQRILQLNNQNCFEADELREKLRSTEVLNEEYKERYSLFYIILNFGPQ